MPKHTSDRTRASAALRWAAVGWLAGTAAVLGCGAGEGSQAGKPAGTAPATAADVIEARSGSRLKARFVEGECGARSLLEFYDSMLGTTCTFIPAGDGQVRCLPTRFTPSTAEFADSECKTPVVMIGRPACDKPDYIFRWDISADRCSIVGRIYQAGERLERTYNNWIAQRPDGRCSTLSFPAVSSDEAYLVGPEVPPATFVRAQRVPALAASTAALVPMVLEAEDGARAPAGWDVGLGTSCDIVTATDNTLRCVPEPTTAPSSFTFSDAECTVGVFINRAGCPAPRYGVRSRARTCSSSSDIFAVGEPINTLYARSAGFCSPQQASSIGEYRAVGAIVPPDAFVALTEAMDEQGTSIKRRYVAAPGTPRVGAGLFNVRRNEICSPGTADGTNWRCEAPRTTPGGSYYADAACTQPVWVAVQQTCPTTGVLYEETDEYACPPHRVLYQSSGPFTGPLFAHITSFTADGKKLRGCQPTTIAPQQSATALTPIPDGEFPPLTVVER